MPVRKRERRIPLRRWPTEDWDYAHGIYRFLKSTFEAPVGWAVGMHVRGRDNVPLQGPVIVACNHYSWADPVLLSAALPRPTFYLAKEQLFRNPVMRSFLEGLGQIKVDRQVGGNEPALATAGWCLEKGLVVGIFPEGTRSRPGEVKRGKTGLARIAARSGATVVPVAMTTDVLWPKDRAVPKFRERVYVNIGPPTKHTLKPEDAADRMKMREFTDDVMAQIRTLLDEAVRAREAREPWG